jgi:hypothetical protein
MASAPRHLRHAAVLENASEHGIRIATCVDGR